MEIENIAAIKIALKSIDPNDIKEEYIELLIKIIRKIGNFSLNLEYKKILDNLIENGISVEDTSLRNNIYMLISEILQKMVNVDPAFIEKSKTLLKEGTIKNKRYEVYILYGLLFVRDVKLSEMLTISICEELKANYQSPINIKTITKLADQQLIELSSEQLETLFEVSKSLNDDLGFKLLVSIFKSTTEILPFIQSMINYVLDYIRKPNTMNIAIDCLICIKEYNLPLFINIIDNSPLISTLFRIINTNQTIPLNSIFRLLHEICTLGLDKIDVLKECGLENILINPNYSFMEREELCYIYLECINQGYGISFSKETNEFMLEMINDFLQDNTNESLLASVKTSIPIFHEIIDSPLVDEIEETLML